MTGETGRNWPLWIGIDVFRYMRGSAGRVIADSSMLQLNKRNRIAARKAAWFSGMRVCNTIRLEVSI